MGKEFDSERIRRIREEFALTEGQAEKLALLWEADRMATLLSYESQEWAKRSPNFIDMSLLPRNITAKAYFEANRISTGYRSLLSGIVTTAMSGKVPLDERGLYGWEKVTKGSIRKLDFAWNKYQGPRKYTRGRLTLSANKPNGNVESAGFILYADVPLVVNNIGAQGFRLDFDIEDDKVTNYHSQTITMYDGQSGIVIDPNRQFNPHDFEELMKGVKMLAADIDELSRLSQNN